MLFPILKCMSLYFCDYLRSYQDNQDQTMWYSLLISPETGKVISK